MSEPKIKKKKATLVTKFAFIIGISVAISVFFMYAYNIYASAPIVEQYRVDKANEYNSVASLIHDRFRTTYFKEARLHSFRDFINDLIRNEMVLHVGLINNTTKEFDWSSVTEFEGKRANLQNPWKDKNFRNYFGYIDQENILIKKFEINDSTVVISFFKKEALLKLVEILKKGNTILAFTFVIFGFLSAFILARQVTQPIEKLVIGVWEFSKGNLKYRTKIKTDDEIGILAKAFNYMAEKLDDLYSSMEKKVNERTRELSSKNEELNKAYEELKDAQSLLVHNEKMRSLGELVAGVAHELNNPINFIYGNMSHLKEYSKNLIELISRYEEYQASPEEGKLQEIEKYKEEIDYEFLKDDILELIKSCTDGADRSKQIILDLKNFSRLDQSLIKEIDVNESIESTLNILKNKYKDRINIIREYGELPKLECFAGQMNQVFMNILDNAAQAIEESGDVKIKTRTENENIVIDFEDTGQGIEDSILSQIFDPFFTTKPVGSGSGLGLSITYKIIKSHNGDIKAESEIGKGTKFTVTIPINWQEKGVPSEGSGNGQTSEAEVRG